MGKLLIPLLLILALVGGGFGGHVMRPVPDPVEGEESAEAQTAEIAPEPTGSVVALQNSFIVPVLDNGEVWSHVVLQIGVLSDGVPREEILLQEPRLRDGLNDALFTHASFGGFDGDFTEPLTMNRLRERLNEVIMRLLDDDTARVLITSMTRQDS
ncbi:MAG: flagellar basal body-associated protein FliL [Pseudomonadota bacterium]